jgi:hypothetical protein
MSLFFLDRNQTMFPCPFEIPFVIITELRFFRFFFIRLPLWLFFLFSF